MPRRSARSALDDLRLAIDCLPVRTRVAMLEGIRANEIIVGAYSDRDGGVCPMLAAHRCGGRTSFVSFARAWDRFAGARRARRATRRELTILESQLTASLEGDGVTGAGTPAATDLGAAIVDHQRAMRTRREREAQAAGGWEFLRERYPGICAPPPGPAKMTSGMTQPGLVRTR